jgi:hypothetical protein
MTPFGFGASNLHCKGQMAALLHCRKGVPN